MKKTPRRRPISPDDDRDSPMDRRLALIEGQVNGIRKMKADNRNCVDVIQQIAAIRGGLLQVAIELLTEHMEADGGHGCQIRRSADAANDAESRSKDVKDAVKSLLR